MAPEIDEVVSRGRPRAPPKEGGTESTVRLRDEQPSQNKNLKDAWASLGVTSVFGMASPFHDAQGKDNKKVVMSITTPTKHICLPMALVGKCFTNCCGKHEVLSTAEVEAVASAGGLDVKA